MTTESPLWVAALLSFSPSLVHDPGTLGAMMSSTSTWASEYDVKDRWKLHQVLTLSVQKGQVVACIPLVGTTPLAH